MTIDISPEIIQKLGHHIPEIRARAICNIQSKFQSCRTDLEDLIVNINDLTKRLVKWFDFKPVSHVNQVFEILLSLLKSKYQSDAIRILCRYFNNGELETMRIYADDSLKLSYLDEIFQILTNANRTPLQKNAERSKSPAVPDKSNRLTDVNAYSCHTGDLRFEIAWDVIPQVELTALSQLKSSISPKNNGCDLNRALQFFEKYIYDFPGEFFLQPPFIFLNIHQLIDSEIKGFDHAQSLICCLKLTQNLSRRITVRRVASLFTSPKPDVTEKQVTIGSYCFKTFQSVLNLLKNIYTDSNLECINICFQILIEIVDLICKSIGVYSMEIENDYHINQIIEELADFLRFIREVTSNYRRNGHKTNRNNSISILFLLCQLIMLKEMQKCGHSETIHWSELSNRYDTANNLDIYRRVKLLKSPQSIVEVNKHSESSSNTIDDTISSSTLDIYISATENMPKSLWRKELEIALLDYPLKHFYPEINDLIYITLKIDAMPDNSPMKLLMNLAELFEPAVKLLKEPMIYTPEQVLEYALQSIVVLDIIKSDELINLIFNAITKLTPHYKENDQIRKKAETLLWHIMSCGCAEIKRLIYKLISEKITSIIGNVIDGKKIAPKSYTPHFDLCQLFGIPLTTEILTEILCNGIQCNDPKTATYAENILVCVLRIKHIPQHWSAVSNFLIPVLPLILCYARTTTKLGSLILSVVEPDTKNVLPTITLIKSSVSLLFSRDTHTQSEGMYRLLYLLENIPNAEYYMPNVNCIRETIPNNICIVEPITYSNNEAFSYLYDAHLIEDFLDILQNQNTEPSIRHSTLKQLNIIVEDPTVLNCFYERNGHMIILNILDKSLRDTPLDNFSNNVIEIIGILSKLCIRIPLFRHKLEDDIQTYVLILRSLLLFLTDDHFRRDCAILLFSLAYSNYIIGGNKKYIVPLVCKKLFLPIVCEFDFKPLPKSKNLLDMISMCDKTTTLIDTNSNNLSDTSEISTNNSLIIQIPQIWRYIRMSFSALWFGSLDYFIDCPNYLNGSRGIEFNYKTNNDSLTFHKGLCVTASDLEIIEGSSPKYGLNYWIKHLKNATNVEHVSLSCAAIENFSNVDSMGHRKQWDCSLFLQSIKRFCTIAPTNKQDAVVFKKITRLLSNLIERDFVDVHIWLLKEFNLKNSVYFDLITYPKVSTAIFLNNMEFLEIVLLKTIECESKVKLIQQWVQTPKVDEGHHSIRKGKFEKNLYEKLFDISILRLDSLLEENKHDELRSLVSLIHRLASSGQVKDNEYHTSFTSNKLLKLALAVLSTSYLGSNFTKHCLITIGHLMCQTDELRIEKKYISFLSTLCSHLDAQIRNYSWSILLKIASTLVGAEQIIQEMNMLPGGLYACCLNTLLDDSETAIVRENAGLVFATLITHRQPNNELNVKLYPKSAIEMGPDWIECLIHHQDLMRQIIASIKYVHTSDVIDMDTSSVAQKIIPCNLMRTYCIILNNLLPLKGFGDINRIFIAMLSICKIIPEICKSVNQSSILLLSEICGLMLHCISIKRSLIDQITRELNIVQSLITFLSIDMFESIPKSIKHRCWPNILKVLRRLAHSTVGFQMICEYFTQRPVYLDGAISLFIYGLSTKDINISVMRFIIELMIISQANDYPYNTFADQLNDMRLSALIKCSVKKIIFSADIISQSVVNWLEIVETNESDDNICATELLYKQIAEMFERFTDCTSIKMLPLANRDKCFEAICNALEVLLKCSQRARASATDNRLILSITEQMELVYNHVGESLTEFVRKNGNTKVKKHVNKLKSLFRIILYWYSCDCLQNDGCIQPFISICYKFWPTIGVDAELQNIFMKMLKFITNNSLPVCKSISSIPLYSVRSASFLQSIIEYCVAETSKPKTGQANLDILQMALQIVTNCCCCVEGRMLIAKRQMLHTLNRLHPQLTRNQRPWPQVTNFWLSLFEVITRYPDSSKETHLHLLCNLVESSTVKNRRLALEILRNMTFNSENRTVLLESVDFMRVMYTILDKNEIDDKQLLITVSIWQLVANNAKAKNKIKNSPLMMKLRNLKEAITRYLTSNHFQSNRQFDEQNDNQSVDETIEDLATAVKCTLDILQD